jgi:hypothetical protein
MQALLQRYSGPVPDMDAEVATRLRALNRDAHVLMVEPLSIPDGARMRAFCNTVRKTLCNWLDDDYDDAAVSELRAELQALVQELVPRIVEFHTAEAAKVRLRIERQAQLKAVFPAVTEAQWKIWAGSLCDYYSGRGSLDDAKDWVTKAEARMAQLKADFSDASEAQWEAWKGFLDGYYNGLDTRADAKRKVTQAMAMFQKAKRSKA